MLSKFFLQPQSLKWRSVTVKRWHDFTEGNGPRKYASASAIQAKRYVPHLKNKLLETMRTNYHTNRLSTLLTTGWQTEQHMCKPLRMLKKYRAPLYQIFYCVVSYFFGAIIYAIQFYKSSSYAVLSPLPLFDASLCVARRVQATFPWWFSSAVLALARSTSLDSRLGLWFGFNRYHKMKVTCHFHNFMK